MKISKNKLKCLVNPHIFDRKSKHNNSDGVSRVMISLPIRYRENTIEGVLNH